MPGQGFSEVYARVCRERGMTLYRGHSLLASPCCHQRNCPLRLGRKRKTVRSAPRSLNQKRQTRTRSLQSHRLQHLRLTWEAVLALPCASDSPARRVRAQSHICQHLKGCSGAPRALRRRQGERGHDLYARRLGHLGQGCTSGRVSGARREVFRYGESKEAWTQILENPGGV